MPAGWKRLKESGNPLKAEQAADLMKEMVKALYKVQAIAEMTMPNGTVAPTPLYKDVTPVLKKWEEWK